jgi:hypothetical protein
MNRYSTTLPFLDLIFNALICFVGLFAIAFVMISVEKEKKNIDMKAVYLITVSWPDENTDDVDTYVEDPLGKLIFYQRREQGLMHLDRDDLGDKNDMIDTPFGKVEFKGNREIVTLRGTFPGEYIVNVHMFALRKQDGHETPVKVTLTRIEPFGIIAHSEVKLVAHGEERTAFRFTLDKKGAVTHLEKDLPVSLIEQHKDVSGHSYQGQDYMGEEEWQH